MNLPYQNAEAIARVAEDVDMELTRHSVIAIDEATLPPQYWRRVPDYSAIRKALNRGEEVEGARYTGGIEYILHPKTETKGE